MLSPAQAGAGTIQAAGQIITITAKVSGRITVVVDGAGRIDQVFSNSSENVAPSFVLMRLDGSAVEPNPSLLRQYDDLMKDRTIVYGTLFERSTVLSGLKASAGKTTVRIGSWNAR